ncbi:hypothetical protein [Pseudomonas jessenii]|uniref:hypothetical protein n=1 Tax=Pseudomonas jessenii TaxID=77298 RepID=UPI0032E500BD
MNIPRVLCAIIVLSLSACSSAPLIYNSSDNSPGLIKPLQELLPDNTPVRLFFVHGVGDHCPGYALGPDGWLNDKNAAAMGLKPVSGEIEPADFINVNVYMGGEKDLHSGVNVLKRNYSLALPGRENTVSVEAIEITWSPLTRWLKSNQLGYDSPSVFANKDRAPCIELPDPKIPSTVQAPPRLWLDETIKEQVFDRNLSDAILYTGTYGQTMVRGLAEGICHAITSTDKNKKCIWPSAQESDKTPHKNLFVTHSLGSRMTYDMFLHLLDQTKDSKTNPFPERERSSAQGFIENMIANTPAFYMMANQLSLLGLANVPPQARSSDSVAHPFFWKLFPVNDLDAPSNPSQATSGPQVYGNVFLELADLKSTVDKRSGKQTDGLQIVSFNDTNDLLTWHIPRWYANNEATPGGRPRINVTDVFVQNAPKLLIMESPLNAHVDYFKNPAVRDVIRCGAAHGEVLECPGR